MSEHLFTASPCIRKCGLNDQGFCRGCFRTIDEIIGWETMHESDKQHTVAECQKRRQQRITAQKSPE